MSGTRHSSGPKPGGQKAEATAHARHADDSLSSPKGADRTTGDLPGELLPEQHGRPDGSDIRSTRNPLLAAASSVLNTATKLSELPDLSPDQVEGLRLFIVRQVEVMKGRGASSVSPQESEDAIFALVAYVDQAAVQSHWSGADVWAGNLLRVEFFGGISLVDRLHDIARSIEPSSGRSPAYVDFVTILFALGLRSAGLDAANVETRSVLASVEQRPGRERLSGRWAGEPNAAARLRILPMWALGVLVLGALLFLYLFARWWVSDASDVAASALAGLGRERVEAPALASAVRTSPASEFDLRQALRADVESGRVQVEVSPSHWTIRLSGDTTFRSASAEPSSDSVPTIDRIGSALSQVRGRIEVIGHTDDIPIRSLRFQSNIDLSRARAMAVQSLLFERLPRNRVSVAGLGATSPICVEPTSSCRALNRRVEIVVARG